MQLLVQLFDAPWVDYSCNDWNCDPVQGPHELLSEYVTDGSNPAAMQEELTEAGYYTHVFDIGECYFRVTAI